MPTSPRRSAPLRALLALTTCLLGLSSAFLRAADELPQHFDLPADKAEKSLKSFSDQSGLEVLFATGAARDVTTNAVRGDYPPRTALELMVEGTGLRVKQDEKTGALAITSDPAEKSGPNDQGMGQVTGPGAIPNSRPMDQTVTMNPFEVQADSDKSYGALNSNSITAFTVALDHLPVTADVFDQAFMEDVGATSVETMVMAYGTGASANGTAVENAFTQLPGDHNSGGALSFRGASTGVPQYNGLLLAGNGGGTNWNFTSNYDLERVEIINGPQALLFAGGGAGGVLNLVTKEARIGQPTFGDVQMTIDQYGTKHATLDYGTSAGNLAARVALIDATDDSRRVNIGHQTKGGYVQFAGHFWNTIVRLTLQQSVDFMTDPAYASITSNSGDAFFPLNGEKLTYLLATNQAAPILNGNLNWNNAQSFEGEQNSDKQVSEMAGLDVSSVWTKWLSTDLSVSAGNFEDYEPGGGATINLYTPGASSNPLPGNWTLGSPGTGNGALASRWRPNRNKAYRFSAVLTNDLFGGRAKSETSISADYTGRTTNLDIESWYLADANGNLVANPALANGGRTLMPTQAWTVNNGPQYYSLFNPGVTHVTLNGVNYIREFRAQVLGTDATPTNPLGLIPGAAGTYQVNGAWYEGYGLVNDTQWLDGKLDTLVGLRLNHQKSYNTAGTGNDDEQKKPDFNLGVNYHLLPWLIPYVDASDDWIATANGNAEPNGALPKDSHAFGEEAGIKFNGYDSAVSGSVSFFHMRTTNAEVDAGNVVSSYIDYVGLNGNLANGTTFATTTETEGITAALTATPTKNWRMRFSASLTHGEFENGVTYPSFYNDQFNQNSAGQVTYADGTVVYVPATFNSKQLTVPSTTAGAVPLTVALLSTPGSQYFASPQPVSGMILQTSNGGRVLLSAADPVHGSLLTGAVGLPISAYQLSPALSGVTPIGTIPLVQSGQQIWGYPEYSMNFTNVYEFSSGALNGFKIGGTVSASWKNLALDYYPTGFTGNNSASKLPFTMPMLTRFDLITGYTRKFGRLTYSTQLNVNNLFNHYHVVIFPDPVTGWSVATNLNANFDQQPRYFSWTNTIRF